MQTRRRAAPAVLAVAAVVGAVGVFATWNPFGFVVLRPLDRPYVTWGVAWVLALVAAVLYRPRRRLVLLAALPVAAAVYVTGFTAVFADIDSDATYDTLRVLRTRDHEVRLVDTFVWLEPASEVRVRTRDGLFSRERVVWWSASRTAVDVRLRGDREVEIVLDDGTATYARF